jgi:sugar O-acyltransferase (sialic acid O-acetyltransferase NeuD family)
MGGEGYMQKFVIIGAGGFAREVLEIFDACREGGQNYEVLGYIVETKYGAPGTLINGKPILGDFDWFSKNASEVKAVCGVGDPELRKRLIARASECGVKFGNIIHPSAILSKHVTMGEGIVIAGGSILTVQIRLGNHVHVNLDCTIGHDCIFDNFATLAPGVHVSGFVNLGEGCYIGTGANIIDRINLGEWSVVGAGSVVTKNVPSYSTVVGVPAKVIKIRNKNVT